MFINGFIGSFVVKTEFEIKKNMSASECVIFTMWKIEAKHSLTDTKRIGDRNPCVAQLQYPNQFQKPFWFVFVLCSTFKSHIIDIEIIKLY